MAKVTIQKIKAKPQADFVHPESSRARLSARKVGLNIPKHQPSLTETEQEEADIA